MVSSIAKEMEMRAKEIDEEINTIAHRLVGNTDECGKGALQHQ